MASAEITRPHNEQRCHRYANGLTDHEWALIAPWMPLPSRVGRPRKADLREVMNDIAAPRYLAVVFPPRAGGRMQTEDPLLPFSEKLH
jgi:hypothetical protein